jgi:hypothetical protein
MFERRTGRLKLPNVIAIGPPRTSTTWLEKILRGRVGLPYGTKETQFFVGRYSLGLHWYAAHFRDCPPGLPIAEFAPTYFDSPQARERIARDLPGCRLICTLRDPVDRFYSHYRLWRKIGYTKTPFERAAFGHRQLLNTTLYADHLAAWFDTFGRGRVAVLFQEDLRSDRQKYLDEVCDFIGIERFDVSAIAWADERIHSMDEAPRSFRWARRAQHARVMMQRFRLYRLEKLCDPLFEYCFSGGGIFPPLDRDLEARIRESMRPQIEKLEALLGRDLTHWKTGERRAEPAHAGAAITNPPG